MSPTDSSNQFLDWYLDEIGRYPLLDADTERQLAERVQNGDSQARRRLIQSNLRLVVKIAKKFAGNNFDLLDCIGAGNEGLIVAADKYEPERGVRFANYAAFWIKQRIRRKVKQFDSQITTPRETVAAAWKIRKMMDGPAKPTSDLIEQIVQQSRFSEAEVRRGYQALFREESLHQPVVAGSQLLLEETIGEPGDAVRQLDRKQLGAFVARGLEELPEDQHRTLYLHYGFDGRGERNAEEISKLLDYSRQWILRLLDKGRENFRAWARNQPQLQDLMEG